MNAHGLSARPAGLRSSATYLSEIESLRGIAMLLVYVFHLNSNVAGKLTAVQLEQMSPGWAFVWAGHTGVSLFFVLSGFLLSLPFLADAAGGTRASVRKFYVRRALRILPLYYTAVLIGTVMTAKEASDLARAVPYLAFLTLVPGWTVSLHPYSSTWWSLATEVQYYLVLPLLPLVLRSRVGRGIGLALLLVYAAAYVTFLLGYWRLGTLLGNMSLKLSLFGRAPLFLCGIAVAWVYLRAGDRIRERWRSMALMAKGGADLCLFAVLAALGLLLRWTLQEGYSLAEAPPNFAWHVPEGILWAMGVSLLLLAPLRLKWLIANPIFGHLGILSYSIYLWHTAVMHAVPEELWRLGWRWPAGWNAHHRARGDDHHGRGARRVAADLYRYRATVLGSQSARGVRRISPDLLTMSSDAPDFPWNPLTPRLSADDDAEKHPPRDDARRAGCARRVRGDGRSMDADRLEQPGHALHGPGLFRLRFAAAVQHHPRTADRRAGPVGDGRRRHFRHL